MSMSSVTNLLSTKSRKFYRSITVENLIKHNPFTDDFVKGEIEFMQFPAMPDTCDMVIQHRGIEIKFIQIHGRCDDYLNKNFRVDDWYTPIFKIDGELWMSLSPMEVQSSFFAWWGAAGLVGMGGLGTGYTSLKAAANPNVERVTVFERDERAIDLFKHLHGKRPELEKIRFEVGDMRETLDGYYFDSFFNDVYQSMLPDEVITDIPLIMDRNDIQYYRFWGQELVQLIGLNEQILDGVGCISMVDLDYLRHWRSTDESNMYGPHIDLDYVEQCLRVMADYDMVHLSYDIDEEDYA